MKPSEIIQLNKGDKVFWTDPDRGLCSKYIVIETSSIAGEDEDSDDHEFYGDEVVTLLGQNGDELECYAHELNII